MSKIVIVGGGVVGLFTAWYLRKEGAEVTVIDRGDFSDGCSFGNAGLLVPSHVVPLASPGMLKKGLTNMFRPASAVAARIAPDIDLIQWYLKFTGSATTKHVEDSVHILKDLSVFSKSLYTGLKESGELDFPLWDKGLLMLYKSDKVGEELREEAEMARKAGLKVDELSATQIQQLEPDTLPQVSGGVHYHSDAHLNPSALMAALVAALKRDGVTLVSNCKVEQIRSSGTKAVAIETEKGNFEFDQLVVSAGIWSQKILKQLKTKVAVQPGKGYSFKVKVNSPIHYPALLSDANVAVTPLGGGITQFGGGMELGYSGYKINQARVQQIIKAVGEFYPTENKIQISSDQVWQGHRPCSFDGLPYIGKAPDYSNVFVGTGHSMMGVTLAPATGKLLSEIISGQQTSLNTDPFRVNR